MFSWRQIIVYTVAYFTSTHYASGDDSSRISSFHVLFFLRSAGRGRGNGGTVRVGWVLSAMIECDQLTPVHGQPWPASVWSVCLWRYVWSVVDVTWLGLSSRRRHHYFHQRRQHLSHYAVQFCLWRDVVQYNRRKETMFTMEYKQELTRTLLNAVVSHGLL